MKEVPFVLRSGAALFLLLSSCANQLLIGERLCYGEGVDCESDAPTYRPYGESARAVTRSERRFDVVASRSVAPTWVYEHPVKFPRSTQTRLALAPGGGVWALISSSDSNALRRITAEGELVESHALSKPGLLSVDDKLGPVVMSSRDGRITRTTLGPLGEVLEWNVDDIVPLTAPALIIDAPHSELRVARFEESASHVAAYDAAGALLWRQTQLRDARDVPFQVNSETASAASDQMVGSHQMVGLSDGSVVLVVPKKGPADTSLVYVDEPPQERTQGLTLLEPDGNLRWDMIVGRPGASLVVLAPGLDGGVVCASGPSSMTSLHEIDVHSIDREGTLVASWIGLQTGYYGTEPSAICSDAAGAIYVLLHTGERTRPIPTICRMNASEPSEEVVCLGVEDVQPPSSELGQPAALRAITAPEPGVVVFSAEGMDWGNDFIISRVVRVDF